VEKGSIAVLECMGTDYEGQDGEFMKIDAATSCDARGACYRAAMEIAKCESSSLQSTMETAVGSIPTMETAVGSIQNPDKLVWNVKKDIESCGESDDCAAGFEAFEDLLSTCGETCTAGTKAGPDALKMQASCVGDEKPFSQCDRECFDKVNAMASRKATANTLGKLRGCRPNKKMDEDFIREKVGKIMESCTEPFLQISRDDEEEKEVKIKDKFGAVFVAFESEILQDSAEVIALKEKLQEEREKVTEKKEEYESIQTQLEQFTGELNDQQSKMAAQFQQQLEEAKEELLQVRKDQNKEARKVADEKIRKAKEQAGGLKDAESQDEKNLFLKKLKEDLESVKVVDEETGEERPVEIEVEPEDAISEQVLQKAPKLRGAQIILGGGFDSFNDKTEAQTKAADPAATGKNPRVILEVGDFTSFKGAGSKLITFTQTTSLLTECECEDVADVDVLEAGEEKCCHDRCFVIGSATYTGTPASGSSTSSNRVSPSLGAAALALLLAAASALLL
jgi:hypothetical protein